MESVLQHHREQWREEADSWFNSLYHILSSKSVFRQSKVTFQRQSSNPKPLSCFKTRLPTENQSRCWQLSLLHFAVPELITAQTWVQLLFFSFLMMCAKAGLHRSNAQPDLEGPAHRLSS